MAVRFTADGQDYTSSTIGLSGGPLTVACWVKLVTDPGTYSTVFSLDAGTTTGNMFVLQTDVDSLDLGLFSEPSEVTLAVPSPVLNVGDWYRVAFVYSGTTGTLYQDAESGGGTREAGVGGIDPPAAGPGVTLVTADIGSRLEITTDGVTYDGGGHSVPGITIEADDVTIQNFVIHNCERDAVSIFGANVTVQNCDIYGIADGGEGDINAFTVFGDGHSILYNTAGVTDFLVSGDPGGSHTDFVQSWNTSSKRSTSNLTIQGNVVVGPATSDERFIHQGVQGEGKGSTDGGGGGTGVSQNWLIADNIFDFDCENQILNFLDIDNVKITRNTFSGSASRIVGTGDGSTGIVFYDDNIITGSYGTTPSQTPGPGPGAPVGGSGTGELVLTSDSDTLGTVTGLTQLRIGESVFGAEWWRGRVANFKVWNAALTQAEIENELAQYVPHRTANLLRWHPFLIAETTDYSGADRTLTGGTGATTEDGPPIPWHVPLRRIITTGTGGSEPPGTTMPEILRLGAADGLTKVNLGVDYLPGEGPPGEEGEHVDYDLADIEADLELPGYADIRTDVGAVRLTSYVGAATTPNSTHSRVEYRELASNGTSLASWSNTSGEHYVWVRGAIVDLAPGRPHVVIAQIHDADDDVATIRVENTTVVSTFGDSGRPGTLATGLVLGSVHEWMIKTIRSGSNTIIQYYWDNMDTPVATQSYAGGSGNYFKFGNYHQSSTSTDAQGDVFIVDLYDSEIWHTGYPEPTARHSEGGGGGEEPPPSGGGGSTSPVFRSATTDIDSTNTSSVALAKPAGLAVGDLMLIAHVSDADGSLGSMTASGFTPTGSQAGNATSNFPFMKIWEKIATSGDVAASSFALGTSSSAEDAAAMIVIEKDTFDPDNPTGTVSFTTQARTSSQVITAPSVTGVEDGMLVIVLGADTNNVAQSFPTPPTSMTERADAGADYALVGVFTQLLTAGGATGTRSATPSPSSTQNGWTAASFVINPAPGAQVTGTAAGTLGGLTATAAGSVAGIVHGTLTAPLGRLISRVGTPENNIARRAGGFLLFS